MDEAEVTFPFNARYYKSGTINHSTKHIWFVLHGYGQLAQYFIKKFKGILNENTIVIAPEALSRFYLETLQPGGRKHDRVGATWMTRDNREMDIRNYVHYLNAVYSKEVVNTNALISVLGFSQGAATATRWVINGEIHFDRLILWSGMLPHDMNLAGASQLLKEKEVVVVYGNDDPFISDERFHEMKTYVQKLNEGVKEIIFKGGHDIDEATLLTL